MVDEIICIHGVPRSGTSYLGQILDSHPKVRYKFQPLFSDTFKSELDSLVSGDKVEEFFGRVYSTSDDFLDRTLEKRIGSYPSFEKNMQSQNVLVVKHVRHHDFMPQFLKCSKVKLVIIVRNPCGVLSSWSNAPKEFRVDDGDFLKEWRQAEKRNSVGRGEYFGYIKWKEFTSLALEIKGLYPGRVHIVKYEDLVNNTFKEVSALYEFLNLDVSDSTRNFIKASKARYDENPYSVFKGDKNVLDWKATLNPQIEQEIVDDLRGTEFEQFLNIE